MMDERLQVGRLALRVEGDCWVAYYALPDTMDEAIFLGSIRIDAIRHRPERKDAFSSLMRAVVGDLVEDDTGARPIWNPPQRAPSQERQL